MVLKALEQFGLLRREFLFSENAGVSEAGEFHQLIRDVGLGYRRWLGLIGASLMRRGVVLILVLEVHGNR